MRFEFLSIPALPRLAWGACIRAGDPTVRVLHGAWVETRSDAFVEGAWDAPFGDWGFDRSADLAGSGGRVTESGVLFATPANMYERLQSARVGDTLVISNSLAFVLALSGERLDAAHRHYYLDLLDFYRCGIRVKTKHLRLAGNRRLALHDCCNLEVAADGTVTRIEKPWDSPPASYADYVDLLAGKLRRTIDNAGDGGRRWRYRPLTMVSHGYDSTAVAVLAARLGADAAVTFLRSYSDRGYADDNGEAIARRLGLAVTTYERKDAVTLPHYRAEEFYLEPWGVDRTMAVMEDQLTGSLLLSGRSGEIVWSRGGRRHWGLPDLQHPMNQTPGCALGEFRLRTGFLHFAPATIAAIHAPRIHAWNEAPEMQPWSIGGDYDKPIARRIIEESGLPRHLFGQEKKGGHDRSDEPARSRLERVMDRLDRSPRIRALIFRTLGNRFHPRWKTGSFEVQEGAERMIERYRLAVAADSLVRSGRTAPTRRSALPDSKS